MFPSSEPTPCTPSLANFGLESLVYVRPIRLLGRRVHIIHAADGTPLTVVDDREQAFAAASQYGLNPMSWH